MWEHERAREREREEVPLATDSGDLGVTPIASLVRCAAAGVFTPVKLQDRLVTKDNYDGL